MTQGAASTVPASTSTQHPAAVAISSNSAVLPGMDTPLVTACLAGDEDDARRLATTLDGTRTYAGAKLALARWVRRNAPDPEWAGAGIRLNAVAPGVVDTTLHKNNPKEFLKSLSPMGTISDVTDIVDAVVYLTQAGQVTGEVLHVDGGAHSSKW